MLRRDEDIFWIIPLLVERVVVVDGHRLLQHRSLLFNSIDGEFHRICKKCRRISNKRILESLLSTSCWDEYSLPSISLESRGTSNSSEKRATKYIFIIITELKCAPWRTMFSREYRALLPQCVAREAQYGGHQDNRFPGDENGQKGA